jgi:hypothetical protein
VAIDAIAADDAEHTAELQGKLAGIGLLRDDGLATSAAFGLKVGDAEAPWPATYVIDDHGVIRYRRLRNEQGDWPTYAEVAAALDQK